MSLVAVKKSIEDRFVANWLGTNLSTNVRWENVPFTPPTTNWVSLDIVQGNSQNTAICTGMNTRRTGFIIIDAYALPDQGAKSALELIEEANTIFENRQFDGIQCLASRIRHIGINNTQGADATWYMYRTSIPYYKYVTA